MLFKYKITETFSKTVIIEEDTEEEAEARLIDEYDMGHVTTSEENFEGASIKLVSKKPKVVGLHEHS